METMRRLRLLLPVLAGLCLPAAARAARTCSMDAGYPTPIAFGTYNPGSPTPDDSTGTVSFTCTPGPPLTVLTELSTGNGGSFNPRQMASGTDVLTYNLYSDSARTVIWGSNASGPYQGVSTTLSGATRSATLTIYGRIFTGQWVTPAPLYSDKITVTVSF